MSGIKIKVRMYKLNELGDCFQLMFTKAGKTTTMLIDCGTFRNSNESKTKIAEVLTEVYKTTKQKPIDIVVATHQHNDHVSGFTHSQAILKKYGIKESWLSWLDDPKDKQAVKIGKDHKNLASKLAQLTISLEESGKLGISSKKVKEGKKPPPPNKLLEKLKDITGFYFQTDAKGVAKVPAEGINNLKEIADKISYLNPGSILNIPGFTENEIKVYVLGPPRDAEHLYDINPSQDESYDKHLALMELGINKYMSALTAGTNAVDPKEINYPFDGHLKLEEADWRAKMNAEFLSKSYDKHEWRTISKTWLENLEGLALYLDTYTNNSSLVLAFELVKEKKVMLFVGDAQTGNWVSWKNIIWEKKGDGETVLKDLLSKMVLYKVGHHGSHNATLKEYLEDEVIDPEKLVAMIPVHKKDPNITKANGWKMPAPNLYKRLKEKTNFKILRMDETSGFAEGCDPGKSATAKKAWGKLAGKVKNTKLYVEMEI